MMDIGNKTDFPMSLPEQIIDRQLHAGDAVGTLCRYARERLRMHQLWCNVGADNEASLGLFRKLGFREVGTKRDWLWTPDGYRDEVLLQKILK